jgi:hypothetical protein
MVALQRPKAGSHLSAGTFVRTTCMLTIFTLPMEAAASLDRLVRQVSKGHKALPVRALALR